MPVENSTPNRGGGGYNATMPGIRVASGAGASVMITRAGVVRVRYSLGNWGWGRTCKNGTQVQEVSSGGGGNTGMVDITVVPGDVISVQVRGNTGSDTTSLTNFRILSGTPAFGAVI